MNHLSPPPPPIGSHRRSIGLPATLLLLLALASTTQAGRNSGGALIVHTNDAVNYTPSGDYCGTSYSPPDSCEAAGTRTDKDENTPAVIWLLAAFPDTSSPEVTAIQFGIDHNLPAEQGYIEKFKMCADLEMPDAGWPETGFGNLVSFGSSAHTELLFPFYFFAVYGFEGAYFGTTVYPSTEEAKFVDDSEPPVEDLITRFGTVRWYAAGSNDCPGAGGEEDLPDDPGGEDVPDDPGDEDEAEEGLDGDGDLMWVRDRILVRFSDEVPMMPRGPIREIGIEAVDQACQETGVTGIKRLLILGDDDCAKYPVGSRLAVVTLASGSDEEAVARRFRQLPEVVWALPDYASSGEVYGDPDFEMQWYLGPEDPISCLRDESNPQPTCCDECGIGVDDAWDYSRGNPNVLVAFIDRGADMQHPDLIDAYAVNPGEDVNSNGDADLCPPGYPGFGDINGLDDDDNGVDDDVMFGWHQLFGEPYTWHHPPSTNGQTHGSMVAGILGAWTDNEKGIASVAGGGDPETIGPGIRLIQFSYENWLMASTLINSMYYSVKYGATVYSSSADLPLGAACCFDDIGCFRTPENEDACTAAGGVWVGVADVVQELGSALLFVQAVGNHAQTPLTSAFATLPQVMAVGGYECESGGRWVVPEGHGQAHMQGSDYGLELSVMGPTGDNMTDPGGGYMRMVAASTKNATGQNDLYTCNPTSLDDPVACFGGTSQAAPVVASVAALVFSYLVEHAAMPPVNILQMRQILEHTAEDILCDPLIPECDCSDEDECVSLLGRDEYSGYGRIDAGRALTLPVAILDPLDLPNDGYALHGETIHLSWEVFDINSENGNIYDDPAGFALHYLIPEQGLAQGWHLIDDTIDITESTYDWVVPNTVTAGEKRRIRLTVQDSGVNTNQDYSGEFWVLESSADVGEGPERGVLEVLVSPNPFSSGAQIRILPWGLGEARVDVIDVGGRCVRSLSSGMATGGSQAFVWDGTDEAGHRVPSGIYMVRAYCGRSERVTRLLRIN